MTATVTVSTQEMELSPQRVTWKYTDLGGTLGNVKVAIKVHKSPINADQYGDTMLDQRIVGMEANIETNLAQTRSLEAWGALFPSFDLNMGNIIAELQIGRSDVDNSGHLNLHPIVLDDADLTQDYNFYQAYPTEDSEFVYSPTEQVQAKIVWNAYPVITGSGAPKFGVFGAM